MKVSKYSFLFELGDEEFYIYNSLSNALLEIDAQSYKYLEETKEKGTSLDFSVFEDDFYNTLINKKFITENDKDDFLMYKSAIICQRSSTSSMHITIAPTMDCVFRCHYCFEKYKHSGNMDENTMDSIVKYLQSLKSNPNISITWFGGEPLMAIDQIEQLYDKITKDYKKPMRSEIVTTGYHITPSMIDVFKKIGVKQLQITLDGIKETHNKIKQTKGCDDAFSKVLDNVEIVMKNAPEINVVFRVNLTKLNAHEYVPLYRQLVHRYRMYGNFGISPGIVMERGACKAIDHSIFFTPEENAEFNLNLYNQYGIYTSFMRYPSRFFQECGIRNAMSIAFDPEGYAYKCWELIGNKDYAYGKLNCNGELELTNMVSYNRQMYGADPLDDPNCIKCEYLPICHGGCPVQRLENEFECKNNDVCTYYKSHLADFMKIHIIRKKLKDNSAK